MTTTDLFGPWPAGPQEREAAVRSVFGEQGPLRQVQMRAVRQRCPGCHEPPGQQCTQGRPGGRRLKRRTCHSSRVAIYHPCPEHGLQAGQECPADSIPWDYQLAGSCAARQETAKDALRLHAEATLLAARDRWRRDEQAAQTQRAFIESRLTTLDPRG